MYSILSEEIVLKIRKEVEKIKEEYQIVNPIVRSDIFEILDNICVVFRYPLDNDEEANGIHVDRWTYLIGFDDWRYQQICENNALIPSV